VKVLVVDDHPIVISGLVALLSEHADMDVLAGRDAAEGQRLFEVHRPDVSVIDINLPGVSGFDLARTLLGLDPDARMLFFSMNDDPMLAVEALDAGAKGFVSKNDDPALFREAILAVSKGETWLPAPLVQEVALIRSSPQRQVRLSSREIEVLRQLASGLSMAEIASRLDVSYKTIATASASIRNKLKARTPAEMVRIAMAMKVV
jgi:two-component system invasion response regulator UvrY